MFRQLGQFLAHAPGHQPRLGVHLAENGLTVGIEDTLVITEVIAAESVQRRDSVGEGGLPDNVLRILFERRGVVHQSLLGGRFQSVGEGEGPDRKGRVGEFEQPHDGCCVVGHKGGFNAHAHVRDGGVRRCRDPCRRTDAGFRGAPSRESPPNRAGTSRRHLLYGAYASRCPSLFYPPSAECRPLSP